MTEEQKRKRSRLLEEFEEVADTFGVELALASQKYIIEILRRQGELDLEG